MTNKEHLQRIERAAQTLASAVNEAVADDMAVKVEFDKITFMGGRIELRPLVTCEPNVGTILLEDKAGCDACRNWLYGFGCERGVIVDGAAPAAEFACRFFARQ